MIVNIAVILDTHDMCHDVIFNIGATSTTSRSWDIRVTQYDCGQEDSSGSITDLKHSLTLVHALKILGWNPLFCML